MLDILGTVISVDEYLQRKEKRIDTGSNGEAASICLSENRVYVIPSYQREMRWEKSNASVLLSDLSNGPLFLGNIIMSIRENGKYEIIDGQQRTMILVLIIVSIRLRYGDRINVYDPCEIDNESFNKLQVLIDCNFDETGLPEEEKRMIHEGDMYKQYERIKVLWDSLKNSTYLDSAYKAEKIMDNIRDSKINIIASKNERIGASIKYFLDVNLKGVQLDHEDIFKGYLLKLDNSDDILALWVDNKRIIRQHNEAKEGKEDTRYPLMRVYEHAIASTLYVYPGMEDEYRPIKFGEGLTLSDETIVDGHLYVKGTHLIEVTHNRSYVRDLLKVVNKSVGIMNDIIQTTGPSDSFKSLFISDDRIDSNTISVFHKLLQKVLLEANAVPKMLVMKYIISLFNGESHKAIKFKSLYSVFTATVLFSLFAKKKESEVFFRLIRDENWNESIVNWCKNFEPSEMLTKGRLMAPFKYTEDEEDQYSGVRCKSLAAIVSYFRLASNEKQIKITNTAELKSFLTNDERFSIEHLIIAKSGKLEVKTEKYKFEYRYPAEAKKCMNSLFNYIYIPKQLNGDLADILLTEKLKVLASKNLHNQYSTLYIELLSNRERSFPAYPSVEALDTCENEQEAKEKVDNYFKDVFIGEFFDFARALLESIHWLR